MREARLEGDDYYSLIGKEQSDAIQLLEYSKTSPSPPSPSSPSRSGYPPSISGTKCGIIDPLVSKRPEKILNRKKKLEKLSKMVKMV